MTDVVLKTNLSLGDIIALTTTVRALSESNTRVFPLTSCREVWDNNPHVFRHYKTAKTDLGTVFFFDNKQVNVIEAHYGDRLSKSNNQTTHFASIYTEDVEKKVGKKLPYYTYPELYLSDQEKEKPPHDLPKKYWVLNAGGKKDFTTKWWPHAHAAKLVKIAKDVQFVQIGNLNDAHFPIPGAINLIGKTTLRELFSIIYHSSGVVTPISAPMHIAAALTRELPQTKPCIVLAGGREPPTMIQYPGQKVLSTLGDFKCCAKQGCWKNRVLPLKVNISDEKLNKTLCELPFEVEPERHYASCMASITPEKVLQEIEDYEIRRSSTI